jgi:hypothetical protein
VQQLSATIACDAAINTIINAVLNGRKSNMNSPPSLNLSLHHSAPKSRSLLMTLPLDAHTKTEGDHSSHSHNFQPHHFQCDIQLPRVDVTKFYGSDPTGWVTQMEHYFSLYNITDDLAKLLIWCSPSRSRTLAMVAMEKNFSSRVYCLDTICG